MTGQRTDDEALRVLPLAHRLIHAVNDRDPGRVRAVIAAATGDGTVATLAIVLAELAPSTAERAVLTVLRNADGPADAGHLLDVLGLAGRQEAA